jgi:type IV fimbrial biogenesis protein FimT
MEGDWSAGQIVYIDRDQNGAIDAEDLLYTHGPVKGSLTFSAFGSNNKVTYDPIGATFSNGTLVLCPENKQAKFARAIIINSAGRARLSQDQDQDGLHENGSGKSLTCH